MDAWYIYSKELNKYLFKSNFIYILLDLLLYNSADDSFQVGSTVNAGNQNVTGWKIIAII
jgi:hypothetical protein